MTKPEPPPKQWASLLSNGLSSVSNWDPLGIALDEPPLGVSVATKPEHERPLTMMDPLPQPRPARAELVILTKAVIEVIEDAQGLPYARGTDPNSLVKGLSECLHESKGDAQAALNELRSLRSTVALLQEERRHAAKAAAAAAPAPPPAPAAPAAANGTGEGGGIHTCTGRRTCAACVQAAADAEARAEAAAAAERGAARAAAEAAAAEAAAALAVQREESARRCAAEAARAARAEESAAEATAAAAAAAAAARRSAALAAAAAAAEACVYRAALVEMEAELRFAAEAHRSALQQTRQKAAKMLARKDMELSAARRAGGGAASAASAATASAAAAAAAGAATAAAAAGAAASGSRPCSQPLTVDAAVNTDASRWLPSAAQLTAAAAARQHAKQHTPRTPNGGGGGGGGGEAAAAAEEEEAAAAAAVLPSPDGVQALAVRFAERVAQLEASLAQAHARAALLDSSREHAEQQARAARARLKQQARALERVGGVPAELRDREYMHNVMYKFLTLPTEPEREALLPVLVAA